MSSVVSASSATITSILSTVETTATTAERAVRTVSSGLDMLDAYVAKARTKQKLSMEKDLKDFEADMELDIIESAVNRAEKKMRITAKVQSDDTLKEFYLAELARYNTPSIPA